MSEVTLEELKEFEEHHERRRKFTCFGCSETFFQVDHIEVLDGRYKFCEDCCDEYTEVMDEIDAERRRLRDDLTYLIKICESAIELDDKHFTRGFLKGALQYLKVGVE